MASVPKEKIDPLHLVIHSSEENDIYFNPAFSCFKALPDEKASGAATFLEHLNVFPGADVSALSLEMGLLKNKT